MIKNALPGQVIQLGKVGENQSVHIQFNLKYLVDTYGSGAVSLLYGPNGALTEKATGFISENNPIFVWTITNEITTRATEGACQLVFKPSSNTNISVESVVYQTIITESALSSSIYDVPVSSWYEEFLATKTQVLNLVTNTDAEASKISDEDPTVSVNVVDNHLHFAFGIPVVPFQIKQTYGTIEQVQSSWSSWSLGNMVAIQADSGLDNGNIYSKVSLSSFVYPSTTYQTVTKQTGETCRQALQRAIPSPTENLYAVIDDTYVFIYNKTMMESSPSWHALWTKGWDFICSIEGPQGIKGDQGYQGVSITSMSIDDNGNMKITLYNPADGSSTVTPVIPGDNILTKMANFKNISERYAKGTENGTPVTSGIGYNDNAQYYADQAHKWTNNKTDTTDVPGAQNNAKWYAEEAARQVTTATGQAEIATQQAELATDKADEASDSAEAAEGFKNDASNQKDQAGIYAGNASDSADEALLYKNDALGSKTAAEIAKNAAETAKNLAEDFAQESEAWAKGTIDGTEVPTTDARYHNNSKWYAEYSEDQADRSEGEADESERWARGTINNVEVQSGQAGYHDNSKYYSEQSEMWATGATSGTPSTVNNAKKYSELSSDSATASKEWANGRRDASDKEINEGQESYHKNARYWSEQAAVSKKSIDDLTATAFGKDSGTNPEVIKTIVDEGLSTQHVNFNFGIPKGDKGDTGYYFTPSVDDNSNISWTNNGNLPNPTTKNIRGLQGIGIESVQWTEGTHQAGTYDTYQINWTDSSKQPFTFKIWNGADGSGAGTVTRVNNVAPIEGNVTLNKTNGNIIQTTDIRIEDHVLFFDF